MGEVKSTIGVVVKCKEPYWTTISEDALLEHIWQWVTKAGVAKRIRYPCSSSRKRCDLLIAIMQLNRETVKFAAWRVRTQV